MQTADADGPAMASTPLGEEEIGIEARMMTAPGNRQVLNPLSPVEAMELLLGRLSKTKSNAEFLASMSAPA